MVKFQLTHLILINDKQFYAIIEPKGKRKYLVTLYLGDKMIKPTKELRAQNLRGILSRIKGEMSEFFFTKLSEYIKEEEAF